MTLKEARQIVRDFPHGSTKNRKVKLIIGAMVNGTDVDYKYWRPFDETEKEAVKMFAQNAIENMEKSDDQ